MKPSKAVSIAGVTIVLAVAALLLAVIGSETGFLSTQVNPNTSPLCSSPSATGGFTLQNCVPDGVAGKDTIPQKLGGKLDVAGVRTLVNEYIVVFLLFLASMAVAVIVFKATDIVLYATNDTKRKEAIKAIQWVLFGLLGATLSYMIITSIIRGFYGLANG